MTGAKAIVVAATTMVSLVLTGEEQISPPEESPTTVLDLQFHPTTDIAPRPRSPSVPTPTP